MDKEELVSETIELLERYHRYPAYRELGQALWDEDDPSAWEKTLYNPAITVGLLEGFATETEHLVWLAALALLLRGEDITSLRQAVEEARERGTVNPVVDWFNGVGPKYPEADEVVDEVLKRLQEEEEEDT